MRAASIRCTMLVLLLSLPGMAAEHPRLFFTAADIPALRSKITGGIHKQMYQRLLADMDRNEWGSGTWDGAVRYDVANRAMRRSFLYVLTGDDAHAKAAKANVETLIASSDWANSGIHGLALYMLGTKVAFAYDWCHGAPSWDTSFSQSVSQKLKAMADVIRSSGGKNQNTNSASNWQGSRGASGGLCYLACDESYDASDLSWCYDKVRTYVRENLGTGSSDSRGWNIEGLGYNLYPWGNFIGPFGAAMQRHDSARDLRKACSGAEWTLWTTYAATVKIHNGLYHPDFGDDNANATHEGTAGLAFWWSPQNLKPGLVHWYDRMYGSKGNGSYDPARGGTIWSLLFHPGSTIGAQDPMTMSAWRAGFADTGGNGMFTWRDAYQDRDDIVAQVYAKLRGAKGHNGPDGLSFRIFGLDSAFATGGGRYGTKINGQDAYLRSMNSLYPVDPDATLTTNGNSGSVIGTPTVHEHGGGHLVAAVGTSNLNVKNWKRRFFADYSAASGAAGVFIISDSSDDGRFWQLCTLDDYSIATSGNTFTITGNGGNSLRGTVLYQKGSIEFKTGVRKRGSDFLGDSNRYVHFQSSDGDFLVVLTLVKSGQAHPAVAQSGSWSGSTPSGTVTVGNLTVRIDGDAITTGGSDPVARRIAIQVPEQVEVRHAKHPTIQGTVDAGTQTTTFDGLSNSVDHSFDLIGSVNDG